MGHGSAKINSNAYAFQTPLFIIIKLIVSCILIYHLKNITSHNCLDAVKVVLINSVKLLENFVETFEEFKFGVSVRKAVCILTSWRDEIENTFSKQSMLITKLVITVQTCFKYYYVYKNKLCTIITETLPYSPTP